jgi:DNA adenine methylase Dam
MRNNMKDLPAITYPGAKHKYMPFIRQFSNRFDDKPVLDAFCGGLGFSMNCQRNVICNDINTPLIDMYKKMKSSSINDIVQIIEDFNLNDKDSAPFYNLSKEYDKTKNGLYLYVLHLFSFSSLIRFSSNGNYNAAFANRAKYSRTSFNKSQQDKFSEFKNRQHRFTFSNKSFRDLDFENKNLFIDPPYLSTKFKYSGWEEKDELELLDKIKRSKSKFIITNNLSDDINNYILKDWALSNNFKIEYFETMYRKQKKGASFQTEVLIHNM